MNTCLECGKPHNSKRRYCLGCSKIKVIELVEINPTLSIAKLAAHFELSQGTISRLFNKKKLKKWF